MSELYDLPDGWEWKKLSDLAKFQSGGTPSRNNKTYWDGDIHWVKISDITDDMYVSNTEEFITKDGLDNSSAKLFPRGTILYSIFATIGKIGILDIEATTNQAISGIQPKENVNLFYMYYGLKFITNEVQKVSAGVAQNNINLTKLKEQWFPLPPLSEQQRIVAKLDLLFQKIDKSIELHQKNMDEADAFMGSVLNEVFGELEEKYGLSEVGKVTDCIVPQRNKPKQFVGDIPWITTDDLKLFKRISKSTKCLGLTREDIEEVKSKTFPKESVLMSCVGDLGVVAIANAEIVVNQQLHTYQCKDNLLNTFLMYALYVKKDYMYQIANITTVAYMNKTKCNSIPIPLPPLRIQHKVVNYLGSVSEKMEKVKSIQKEKMESLKALKASILDKAFRGELL